MTAKFTNSSSSITIDYLIKVDDMTGQQYLRPKRENTAFLYSGRYYVESPTNSHCLILNHERST